MGIKNPSVTEGERFANLMLRSYRKTSCKNAVWAEIKATIQNLKKQGSTEDFHQVYEIVEMFLN